MAQIGKIEHFQIGEDWESYEERLQQYFKANEITDADKKVAVFLTVVGSHLYKLLRNLVSPSKPAEKSYDEITTVLKQHLVPKPIVIAERLKFRRCVQKPGENIATYLVSLKQLAETCDYKAFLNEAPRDQLVRGLKSEAIQKHLLTEADLDLKKALEISQAMEAATKQIRSYKEQHRLTHIMSPTSTLSRGKDHATVVEANMPQMTVNSRTSSARNATSKGT